MILVQREFTVPREQRAAFEERARRGVWPAFLHFGAPMVAFGSWAFGAPSERLVTHTVYQDFEHWEATRPGSGAYFRDAAMAEEVRPYMDALTAEADGTISTEAQLFDLVESVSPHAVRRSAGEPLPPPPPTFGRGSMISERTLAIAEGGREEFISLSTELIWPWLESAGGRGMAIGSNLMGASNEITTWFAFPSLAVWHRFTRPQTAGAPPAIVDAYRQRQALVRHQRGRLLVIGTDWGREADGEAGS